MDPKAAEFETSYYSVHNPAIILKEMPKSLFFQNIMVECFFFHSDLKNFTFRVKVQ